MGFVGDCCSKVFNLGTGQRALDALPSRHTAIQTSKPSVVPNHRLGRLNHRPLRYDVTRTGGSADPRPLIGLLDNRRQPQPRREGFLASETGGITYIGEDQHRGKVADSGHHHQQPDTPLLSGDSSDLLLDDQLEPLCPDPPCEAADDRPRVSSLAGAYEAEPPEAFLIGTRQLNIE